MEEIMNKAIALYYLVNEETTFEEAAQGILELLNKSSKHSIFQDRILYIDIEGHIDSEGNYDRDMKELQQQFITDFLLQYFVEINTPLKKYTNEKSQNNELPDALRILKS